MINDIIEKEKLTCTQEEFQTYMDNIVVPTILFNEIIYNFDELYNGVKIDNPTGNENAKYYALHIDFNGSISTYLQNHTASDNGFIALTDDNVYSEIQKHKELLTDQISNGYKFHETINHFKDIQEN